MDYTMSPAGIIYKLVEEKPGLHAEDDIRNRALGGMTEEEYVRTRRSLIRLGLLTEVRRRCGGQTVWQLESLSCQRTPFDDVDTGSDQEQALIHKPTAMDQAFGIDGETQKVKAPDFVDTFWRQVGIGDKESCWEWQGLTNSKGYGRVRFNGGDTTAHRVAYQLISGNTLAGGRIKQSCGNKLCCNPHHMGIDVVPTELGTDLGTGNSLGTAGNSAPSKDSFKESNLNTLEEVKRPGGEVYISEDNSDITTTPTNPLEEVEINLDRIHKLSSVSELTKKADTTDAADDVEREMAEVGWNEPPAYWPEAARAAGRFLVFNRPGPLSRGKVDWGNKRVIQDLYAVNARTDMQDIKTGYYVCDDGYVIPLFLDLKQTSPTVRTYTDVKCGWDRERFQALVKAGMFDKYARYTDEVVPSSQVPTVPTPTGTAKAIDNSDLLSTLPTFDGTPVLPEGENDLNGGPAWAYAEEIIRRYRAQQPVKQWHALIGPYPVPEWAEEAARFQTGKHYWELEVAVGAKLEEISAKAVELRAVRGFVKTCLDQEIDPLEVANTWGGRVAEPTAYLCSATYKLGGTVANIPNSPRPVLLPVAPLGLQTPEVLEAGDHFPKASAPSTSSPVVYRVRKW